MLRLFKRKRTSEDSRIKLVCVTAELNLVIMYSRVDKCSWILVSVLLAVLMRTLPGLKIEGIYLCLIIFLHINCHTETLMRMVSQNPMFYAWTLVWMICMLQIGSLVIYCDTDADSLALGMLQTALSCPRLLHCGMATLVPCGMWKRLLTVNTTTYLLTYFLSTQGLQKCCLSTKLINSSLMLSLH